MSLATLQERIAVAWRRKALFDVYGITVHSPRMLPSQLDAHLELRSDIWWDYGLAAALASAASGDPYGLHPPDEYAFYEIVSTWTSKNLGQVHLICNFEEENVQTPVMCVAQSRDGSAYEVCRIEQDGTISGAKWEADIRLNSLPHQYLSSCPECENVTRAVTSWQQLSADSDLCLRVVADMCKLTPDAPVQNVRSVLAGLLHRRDVHDTLICPVCHIFERDRRHRSVLTEAPCGNGPTWIQYFVPVYRCECCRYEDRHPYAEQIWRDVRMRYCSVFCKDLMHAARRRKQCR